MGSNQIGCKRAIRTGSIDPGAKSENAADTVLSLYDGISAERVIMEFRDAALLKLVCNAFHATKINFANEIHAICAEVGADASTLMAALCADRRLNISCAYLKPGFAFGGPCLPKDLDALLEIARRSGVKVPALSAMRRGNAELVTETARIISGLGPRRVALLGVTFKPASNDLRGSPYLRLAQMLRDSGVAVQVWDPNLTTERVLGVSTCSTPEAALQGVHLIVLAKAPTIAVLRLCRASGLPIYDLQRRGLLTSDPTAQVRYAPATRSA